jgi:hypothetical protein
MEQDFPSTSELSEIEILNQKLYNYFTSDDDDPDLLILEEDYKVNEIKIDIPRETSLGIRKYDNSLDSDVSMKSPKNFSNSSPTFETKKIYISKQLMKYIYMIVSNLEEFLIFINLLKRFDLLIPSNIKLSNYKIEVSDIDTSGIDNLTDEQLLTENVQRFIVAFLSIEIKVDDSNMYTYEFDRNTRYTLSQYWDNDLELNLETIVKFLEKLVSSTLSNIFSSKTHIPYVDTPLMNIISCYEDLLTQNFDVCRDLVKTIIEYCMIFDTLYIKNTNKIVSYITANMDIPLNDNIINFKKSCKFKHYISVKLIYAILYQMEEIKTIEKIKIENFKIFFYLIRSPLFYILFKINAVL